MIRPRFFPGRSAALLLAVLCLAGPVTALVQRLTVHFFATFDMPSAPSNSISAEIGQFNPATPAPTFSVTQVGGQSKLKVSDAGTAADVDLKGIFLTTFTGLHLSVTHTIQPMQLDSSIIFQLEDSSDQGILDCTWGGGGVSVNGAAPLPFQAGVVYDVTMRIDSSPVTGTTWTLEIRDGGLLKGLSSGLLTPSQALSIKALDIIRPAGQPGGTFFVDQIKVVSYDLGFAW